MNRERPIVEVLDLEAAAASGGSGAILNRESEDLDVNLVRFAGGSGVAPHLNREVDVLIVAVAGEGAVSVEGEEFSLEPGKALLIPKKTERAIRSAESGEFIYLSIHRRRARLMPARRGKPQS